MAEGPEVVTEGKREALPVTPRLSPQGSPVSGRQDEKLVPCEIHVCVLGCVSGGRGAAQSLSAVGHSGTRP